MGYYKAPSTALSPDAYAARSKKVNPRHPKDPGLARLFSLGDHTNVTHDTALNVSAVYRAVDVLAADIGTLPVCLYRRTQGGGRDLVEGGSLYDLLREPNESQTMEEFMVMMCGHLFLRGNAYAKLMENGAGEVVAIKPLHPDRTFAFWAPNGEKAFSHTDKAGRQEVLLAGEVMHWTNRYMDADGLMGLSPVTVARRSLSVAIQAETFGDALFRNGARPGSVLKHPGKLSDEAHTRLKESWQQRYGGAANANKTAILEEGMDVAEVGFTPEDAQFLDTRRFQVTEVARWFGVPPHKIGDLDRATFSNIEEQNIDYVGSSVRTWVTKIEQRMGRSLITPARRRAEYIKIKVSELLRGKQKERYESYNIGRQAGFLSANDCREAEGMNRIPNGDVYIQPLNMVAAGEASPADERARPLVVDKAAERVARKQVVLLRKAIETGKDPVSALSGHERFVSEVTGLSDGAAADYVDAVRAAVSSDPEGALTRIQERNGAGLASLIQMEQMQ
jgi:HK97 family phage portal protein